MDEAFNTYYGMHIESWLDDFETHAIEFATDILSEAPMWPLMKDTQGQPYSPLSWAREQRQKIEQSDPIQSYLRLIDTYVDEDEEEEEADDEEETVEEG